MPPHTIWMPISLCWAPIRSRSCRGGEFLCKRARHALVHLLGSGIIKRHYVQPYALGHEIVHSWIGNAVFNHADRGNWVEGLTTYLANYYWHELVGDRAQTGTNAV
jgi:Aminopeptidase N